MQVKAVKIRKLINKNEPVRNILNSSLIFTCFSIVFFVLTIVCLL